MNGMRYLLTAMILCALTGCAPELEPSDARPVLASMAFDGFAPGRTEATIKWTFRIADGWHLYWDGLNDTGAPPEVALTLPEGWTADPPRATRAPRRHVSPGGILDHVFTDRLVMYQTLRRDGDADGDFEARLTWLACKDLCAFGDTLLTSADAEPGHAYREVHTLMEAPPPELDATWHGAELVLTLDGAVSGMEFCPRADCGPLVDLLADGVSDGPVLTLRLLAHEGRYGPVRGILKPCRDCDDGFMVDLPAVPVAETETGG